MKVKLSLEGKKINDQTKKNCQSQKLKISKKKPLSFHFINVTKKKKDKIKTNFI